MPRTRYPRSPAQEQARYLRESRGFDKTYTTGNWITPWCSQCQAMMVNNIAIHEEGCPHENGCRIPR